MLFLAAIAVFFFVSGASGLIYQVVWVRILSLTFGVTVHAVSMVLAGFMAGLALGSYVAGRLADRLSRPLVAYGLVECAIGATALLTPHAFAALSDTYPVLNRAVELQTTAWASVGLGGHVAAWLPGALRLLLAFGILLVPTTLMGATLPVILRSPQVRRGSLGRSVSLLYAVNTFGAIAGTVAAGFYLISGYGIQASVRIAAALNLAVGASALMLSLWRQVSSPSSEAPPPAMALPAAAAASQALASAQPERLRIVYLAFGVSGLCALGYEVIWFRLLSLFVESSTYAFSIMLAMVLLGIAAGSYILGPVVSRFEGRADWWLIFAALEWGIALCVVLSVTVLGRISEIVGQLSAVPGLSVIAALEDGWVILAAFAAIVPAMALSGMTFPVAAVLYATGATETSRRVGSLYASNVLGAIFGSLLAGFVLIPALGSQRSLLILAAGSAVAGAAVLWASPRTPHKFAGDPPLHPGARHSPLVARRSSLAAPGWLRKLALTAAGAALFAAAAQLTPDMYRYLLPGRFPDKEILWYREGLENSVTVVRDVEGYITLHTNYRGQARDEPALIRFHRLLGHMPMLLHPAPQRVLIVGIGGGATSGAVALHPGALVDAVELSDAVIEGARLFAHVNYRFFDLPNVRIRQADARNHLLLSGRRYDVISGDAIRPNDAGAATLFSLEYYRLAAQALEDDGLMTQWLPPFSDYQYRLILRTFLAAFPHATLWQDGDVLIGSKRPITVDGAELGVRFQQPQVRTALAAVGLVGPDEFLRRFNAATEELRAVAGQGPLITDDRPSIEYFRSLPKDDPPDTRAYSRDVRAILR